jgi:hypothetical protein
LNVNVAGWPLIVTESTVMLGPGWLVLFDMLFERSKSRLNSLRHCVECCSRSTCVPSSRVLLTAS